MNDANANDLGKFDHWSILKDKDGYNFQADANGQFELKASVSKQGEKPSYIWITSIILL